MVLYSRIYVRHSDAIHTDTGVSLADSPAGTTQVKILKCELAAKYTM